MKSFQDLIEEVQKAGFCHHCGGCVNFCTAINYGALEQDELGQPRFCDRAKCLECGLCYTICPETHELEDELSQKFNWTPPLGPVIETFAAQSRDRAVLEKATDGGVITSLLIDLLESGSIDGAIVSKPTGPFTREPHLATSRQEILDAAGFTLKISHGMQLFSQRYSPDAISLQELKPIMQHKLNRVAFVGTPGQIKSVRKMEHLELVPADSIKYYFGIFCYGNFNIGPQERSYMERMGNFRWDDIHKLNLKGELLIHLKDGRKVRFSLRDLEFMKSYACRFCPDLTAEFADISFGSLGADFGWTTVITRTLKGHSVINRAARNWLCLKRSSDDPQALSALRSSVLDHAEGKRREALKNREKLGESVDSL
jgi:coenzyme F420 hydrogenase subunit beta